ncbi:MAG: DHH family phosphoesterase [Oscillospiraceae bacterium]|nr:DHH family phosphoesterase [Oscillospiraceae bacterium]
MERYIILAAYACKEACAVNKKISRILKTNVTLYMLCLALFVLAAIPVDLRLAIGEAVMAILVYVLCRKRSRSTQQSLRQYLDRLNGGMDSARASNMLFAPLPMMVFSLHSEEILWGNDSFMQLSGKGEELFDMHVEAVVPQFNTHWILEDKRECPELVMWNDRIYRVFGSVSRHGEMGRSEEPLATTYWMDVTELEQMRQTLEMTQPVVAILMIDNYEELMKACPESKRSAVLAALEEKLNEWAAPSNGLLLGYDRDRFLFVFEEKDYAGYAEKRFDLLERVREVVAGEGVAATLSIGIGRDGDSFEELFKNAAMALEMALSRGGDQAVVKDRLNFDFYGGRSKATEKRTKVKSRVMANALGELIDDAKQVYVMGHKYADMDCLGAAAGICCIARKKGKRVQIVMDTENNAVHPVLRKLRALPEYKDVFIGGGDAFLRVQPGTLLVVVDTNRPASVESESLLETCNRVAVIDHHRRGSSYIEKMALNYHEPYASSASELVTELLQYLVEPGDMLLEEAEALLAGLVLDTKNFTNRTGGRTFEAAAFLRRRGADTQEVQRIFQSDLQSMISRYDIIRQAQLYHEDIAVVALEEECDRVTAAKAADELLTLKGVQASFVLYKKDDGVYISARSLGDVNVQVIVEALGGGGNSTTAGGQVADTTVGEVREKLLEKIDQYFEN